jgi:hypothetical protein
VLQGRVNSMQQNQSLFLLSGGNDRPVGSLITSLDADDQPQPALRISYGSVWWSILGSLKPFNLP